MSKNKKVYVPYKSKNEFIKDFIDRFGYSPYDKPLWIRKGKMDYLVVGIGDDCLKLGNYFKTTNTFGSTIQFDELLDRWSYSDGSEIGICIGAYSKRAILSKIIINASNNDDNSYHNNRNNSCDPSDPNSGYYDKNGCHYTKSGCILMYNPHASMGINN